MTHVIIYNLRRPLKVDGINCYRFTTFLLLIVGLKYRYGILKTMTKT